MNLEMEESCCVFFSTKIMVELINLKKFVFNRIISRCSLLENLVE